MWRRLLAIAALPAAALSVTDAAGADVARLATQKTKPALLAEDIRAQTQPRLLVNKMLGYTVAVPPAAEVAERQGTNQISVRSRKGYVINIQIGPKRPEVPLQRMSSLLEPAYLGDGKPWSARGDDRAMSVAGMPAHDVAYRGTASRARVVVARGAVNDYVFIFIAPDAAFPALETEFDWVLTNFQPNAKDQPQGFVAAAAQPASAKAPAGAKRFAEPGYGYAIDYPADWKVNKPASMATMFSGREGTPDYAAIVGIQNIAPPGARSADEAASRAFNQLKASLGNAVRDFEVLEDGDWTYARAGIQLVGRQILVVYRHAGETFQKRMIVVPRPDGSVAHVWSFTAPRNDFAALAPAAEGMLRTWTILTDRRQ